MLRVFHPTPLLKEGARIEFEGLTYHVMLKDKKIASGEIIEVEDDLINMDKQDMLIKLAQVRRLIRDHANHVSELLKWLPEGIYGVFEGTKR